MDKTEYMTVATMQGDVSVKVLSLGTFKSLLVNSIFCLDTQVSGERSRKKLTGDWHGCWKSKLGGKLLRAHQPCILIGQPSIVTFS